jgi:hypothetical protein
LPAGKQPRQVVQAITRGLLDPIHQAVSHELADRILRRVALQFPNRGRSARFKCRREDGERAPEPAQPFAQQLVAQAERGGEALIFSLERLQPPPLGGEPPSVIIHAILSSSWRASAAGIDSKLWRKSPGNVKCCREVTRSRQLAGGMSGSTYVRSAALSISTSAR